MTVRIRISVYLCLFTILSVAILSSGCENALKPAQTPQHVVVSFLKAIGRSDFESAKAFVVPESQGQMQGWARQMFFPEHSTPPSTGDAEQIDHFIALFYRITPTSEPKPTDTQCQARLVFNATDAMVGFPSVANNPLIPNSALFMVDLSRTIIGEGKDAKPSDWKITSIQPTTEHP